MATADDALANENDTTFAIAMSDLVFAAYGEHGFPALSEAEQTVFCLDALEREVNNGGFAQFFRNESGNTALDTIAALERLGAHHTAGLVKRAVSAFPSGLPPTDPAARANLMDTLPESAEEVWEELDAEFFKYKDKLAKLERQYVTMHVAEFRARAT